MGSIPSFPVPQFGFDNGALKTNGRSSAGTYELNSWNLLNNLYGNLMGTANQFGGQGQDIQKQSLNQLGTASRGFGAAGDYFNTLLKGSKTANLQAAAPGINAITAGADAAKKQEAEMGTARGGGTNAANRGAQSNTTAQIGNLIAGQQGQAAAGLEGAAAGEAGVGQAVAGISATDIEAMIKSLGLGEEAITAVGQQASGVDSNNQNNRFGIFNSLLGIL